MHSHSDAGNTAVPAGTIDSLVRDDKQDLIGNPAAENNVRQGMTTVMAGPDGFGTPQVGAYLAKVAAARPAINLGAFIGHAEGVSTVIVNGRLTLSAGQMTGERGGRALRRN